MESFMPMQSCVCLVSHRATAQMTVSDSKGIFQADSLELFMPYKVHCQMSLRKPVQYLNYIYASWQFVTGNPHCPSSACAPTFEHNPVKTVLAPKNGRVVIECRPKAAPKPTFAWSKDTELLSNSTR